MDKKAKYQDQIKEISKKIVNEPANTELYQKRADLFFEKEQIENALNDYNKILEINPKDSDAFYKRALCFYHQKKIHKCLEDLGLALECNPKNIGVLLLYGTFFVAFNKVDDAIYYFKKVLKIDSNNNEAKEELGKIYYHKKEYEKALEYFKDIDWELDKEIVEKIEEVSNSYLSKGEYDKAIDACEGYSTVLENCWWELGYPLREHLQFINDAKIKARDITIEDIKKRKELDIKKVKFYTEQKYKKTIENMIQQYSHTLANTLFPNSIYEVANKLKKHIEFRKDAMILNDAYHAEVLIKRQGQMLQAKNTGSEKSFQMLIRGDRLDKNTKEKHITIEGILNNSLERILAGRFLNKDYSKLDSIRDILSKKTKMNLKNWNNSFEENVFFNPRQTAIKWANENIAKITYQLSPTWSEIRLVKDNYAEALLQGYFSELFFNALKYRDQNQETWVNITFNEKQISKKTYLISTWENPFLSKEKLALGSGLGLEGIKNDLEMLNETKDVNKTIICEDIYNVFRIQLSFKKDLFLLPPKKEIDYKKLFK